MLVKNIVLLQLRCVKIDVSAGFVCITFFEKLFDHFDVVGDPVCSRNNIVGAADIQSLAVVKECVGVILCYFKNGLVFAARAFEHLVLAFVGVA